MSATWLARVAEGRIVAEGPRALGAAIDSRRLRPGELFVALPGCRTDGHAHLGAAAAAGAAGLLVAEERLPELALPTGPFVLAHPDPRAALARIGAAWRRLCDRPVAAVTGSCGKSTTKEMLRAMLSRRGPVAAAPGSYNNDLGLPLTLLRLRRESAFLVAELGTNGPGEIASLAALAAPDLGIITGVGPVHLEGLGSEEAVAEEKGALAEALPAGGLLVLDRDDPWHDRLRQKAACRVVSVSLRSGRGDLHPERVHWGAERTRLVLLGEEVELDLPGRHNVKNLLLALAAARGLGLTAAEALAGCRGFRGVPGRLERLRLPGGALLLDDTYNSNYPAAVAALEVLAGLPCRGRRVVVLGEMHELGAQAARWHRRLGEELARRRPDRVLLVGGDLMEEAAAAARRAGLPAAVLARCATGEEAAALLEEGLGPADLVLCKASRAVGLDRLVARLAGSAGGAP